LIFSVYISCLYSGFITAAQLSRPTRQRLNTFVVCTPQQMLQVLFTRSTWLSGTVTRCGLRSYRSSSKSTTTLSIFFRNTTSLHPPQQLHSTINSDSVHSPHCRCLIRPVHLIGSNFITRLLFVMQGLPLRSECIIPRDWSDNSIESYNTRSHVLVLLKMSKKSTEHNTNGNGSICYQNVLNFTLEMCEKHKPETRVRAS